MAVYDSQMVVVVMLAVVALPTMVEVHLLLPSEARHLRSSPLFRKVM